MRRHSDPELLSFHRLHRLCMEGARQNKGSEAIPHRKVKQKSSPEGRQLKSKQQESPALLATENTDLDELLPLHGSRHMYFHNSLGDSDGHPSFQISALL